MVGSSTAAGCCWIRRTQIIIAVPTWRSQMRHGKLMAAGAATVALMGVGATALAASPSGGGPIQVFVTPTSPTKAKIVITGAIGHYGTTLTVDKNGKLDANGSYQKVTLKQGGFWLNATALTKKLNTAS